MLLKLLLVWVNVMWRHSIEITAVQHVTLYGLVPMLVLRPWNLLPCYSARNISDRVCKCQVLRSRFWTATKNINTQHHKKEKDEICSKTSNV